MGKRIGGYKKQQKKKKDYQVTVFKCILLAEFYMNRIKVELMSCMSSAVSLCLSSVALIWADQVLNFIRKLQILTPEA